MTDKYSIKMNIYKTHLEFIMFCTLWSLVYFQGYKLTWDSNLQYVTVLLALVLRIITYNIGPNKTGSTQDTSLSHQLNPTGMYFSHVLSLYLSLSLSLSSLSKNAHFISWSIHNNNNNNNRLNDDNSALNVKLCFSSRIYYMLYLFIFVTANLLMCEFWLQTLIIWLCMSGLIMAVLKINTEINTLYDWACRV